MLQVELTERLRAAAARALASQALPRSLRNELASYVSSPAPPSAEAVNAAATAASATTTTTTIPVVIVQQLSTFLLSEADAGAAPLPLAPLLPSLPSPSSLMCGRGTLALQMDICTSCCADPGSSLNRRRRVPRCGCPPPLGSRSRRQTGARSPPRFLCRPVSPVNLHSRRSWRSGGGRCVRRC